MISEKSKELVLKASQAGWSEDDIAYAVKYAERLDRSGLPIIFDIEHLSLLSGFKKNFLHKASNGQRKFYRQFTVRKRDGSERKLVDPLPDLKDFQCWFSSSISSQLPVSKYVHSYRKGRSIKTNARFHLGKEIVVRLDIRDFFGTTSVNSVNRLLLAAGYTKSVARILANLVTLNGVLPQGAPSSPSLSNAIYYELDSKIGSYALTHGWHYTRYADDLTFSGHSDARTLISGVSEIISHEGLELNKEKTRVMRRSARQISCGAVLNDQLGPPRTMRRTFLQEVHFVRKFGISGHVDRKSIDTPDYISTLIGRGSHIVWMMSQHPDRLTPFEEALKFLRGLQNGAADTPQI